MVLKTILKRYNSLVYLRWAVPRPVMHISPKAGRDIPVVEQLERRMLTHLLGQALETHFGNFEKFNMLAVIDVDRDLSIFVRVATRNTRDTRLISKLRNHLLTWQRRAKIEVLKQTSDNALEIKILPPKAE